MPETQFPRRTLIGMGHAFTRRGSLWVGLLRPLFGRFLAWRRGLIWNLGAGFSGLVCVNAFRVNGWRNNGWRRGTPSVFGWAGLLWALVPGVVHPAGALLAQLVLLGLTGTEAVMVYVFVVIENRTIWIRDRWGK